MNNSPVEERAGSKNGDREDRPSRSETSVSASDYYDVWAEQYVLSLDGGGVKGYSSLLILDRLMKYVELEEQRLDRELIMGTPMASQDSSQADGSQGSSEQTYFADHANGMSNGKSIDEPESMDIDSVVPRDPPCLYFDYIFGTSTGGLIAIMLGRLRMKIGDAVKAYQEMAGDIFAQQQWGAFYGLGRYLYDHRKLENAIKIVVRKQIETGKPENEWRPDHEEQRIAGGAFNREPTFHSAPTKCRTVCVAYTDVEANTNKPFLFRSYEHLPSSHFWTIDPDTQLPTRDTTNRTAILQAFEDGLNTGPAHAVPIWQVARATSAAPPYFEPMVIDGETFIDGAVGCNNPARIAYREVALMHNGNRGCIKLLLSIGTGVPEVKPMGRGRYAMLLQLIKLATGALTETEATHEMLSELSAGDGTNWYHRFNVKEQLGAMRMDLWTQYDSPQHPGTQKRIEKLTAEYLRDPVHIKNLRHIAQKLAEVKRRRMATKHWPMAASNERYRCLVSGCDNGQKVRNTRKELLQHIKKDHPEYVDETKSGWKPQLLDSILDAGKIEH